MLTSTCQPHKINLFYTSQGEAHCIQIGRKPQEQRRLNADIVETTRNIVLPSSKINSGGRGTPVCKISKLLQILQNVARCCKMEYFSKLKSENRETTTIEISVVDYPKNDKKAFFEILCNVADAPVLAIAAETRYSPISNTLATLAPPWWPELVLTICLGFKCPYDSHIVAGIMK